MSRLLLLPALALGLFRTAVPVFAQHENDRWVFGGSPFPTNPPAVEFVSGPPNPFPTIPVSSFWSTEASAAVADRIAGTVLFYTDAVKVFNSQNVPMPNGGATFTTNLRGCTSSTQGALILPRPGMAGRYYIFTLDCSESFTSPGYSGLMWSEVDMALDGGLGDVVAATRNSPLWVAPELNKLTEKLTATRHINGVDYWVVVHEWSTNKFLSFLVDCEGIFPAPVTSAVGSVHNAPSQFPSEVIGAMKISPDGSRLALVAGMGTMNIIEVFNFDRATGIVSNPITLPANGNDYGLEFSPGGRFLYTSQYNSIPCCSGKVFQYDLTAGTAAAINASRVTLANSTTVGYGGLQLGPDDRIHIARALQTNNLGIINSPNNAGGAAGFSNTGAALSARRCNIGLPNLVRFQEGPDCDILLPVELVAVDASCANGQAQLTWTTVTEQDAEFFLIERSTDATDWALAGQVPAQGHSTTAIDYQFIDQATPAVSPMYYRLIEVDTDGRSELLRQLVAHCDQDADVASYFDPVQEALILPVGTDPSGLQVVVHNAMGQRVLVSRSTRVPLDRLATGTYVATITGTVQEERLRFVKP